MKNKKKKKYRKKFFQCGILQKTVDKIVAKGMKSNQLSLKVELVR